MDKLNIFISHSSKYAELAKRLKVSLKELDNKDKLEIRISTEMAGATDWRRWIEENVRSANVFLLVYPHARMDMNWCNYELGRFYDPVGHVAILVNTDIQKPPSTFEPYQAYSGDEPGLLKFFNELFVKGVFTSQLALNPDVGELGTEHYGRANQAAKVLAQQFALARVHEQLYDRRIVMTVKYTDQTFDPAQTFVWSNPEGLGLLGFFSNANVPWATVCKRAVANGQEWPTQLERSLPEIARGSLPPSLPPFRSGADFFIPVITKADSVDRVIRDIVIIFVTVARDQIQPLLDWATPSAMPDLPAKLIRFVRMTIRARWDILEPNLQEVAFHEPSKERCANIVESILGFYDQLSRSAQQEGLSGLASFAGIFDKTTLRPKVGALIMEYREALGTLRTLSGGSNQEIEKAIERLMINNAHRLQLYGEHFSIFVNEMHGNETSP